MRYTQKIKLTPSQLRSLASYTLLLLTGLNTALAHAQETHIPLPGWVSAFAVPAVAGGVMLLSRSLNRSRSGTGGGIIGEPQADAPSVGSQADPPPPVSVPAAAVFLSPVAKSILAVAEAELSEPGKLSVKAVALDTLSAEYKDAAKTLMQGMDRGVLLAGIAAKAESLKLAVSPEPPSGVTVPSVSGEPQ